MTRTAEGIRTRQKEDEAPLETGHTRTVGTSVTFVDDTPGRGHQCAGREIVVTGVEGVTMMNLTEHRREGGETTTNAVRRRPSSCALDIIQHTGFQDALGLT